MVDVLERGDIYFAYRPRVEQASARGLEDVQRFFMILSPYGRTRFRLIVIGRKRLPEVEDHREKTWGFVQQVSERAEDIEDELKAVTYDTKTRGERHLAPARPAGEGVYALVRHDDHTHLAYALELPQRPGAVQEELDIRPEASYIITVKNPEQPSPAGVGLDETEQADLPHSLERRFAGRRFGPIDPPEFLDQEGAELVLIGADEDVTSELGIQLNPQHETAQTAEIFNSLHMSKREHPLRPLFTGQWE
jgi:hypothetical protein